MGRCGGHGPCLQREGLNTRGASRHQHGGLPAAMLVSPATVPPLPGAETQPPPAAPSRHGWQYRARPTAAVAMTHPRPLAAAIWI